jgi:hypothetical protein
MLILKHAVFWYEALCRSCMNRHFGGTYRLHLQGRKIRERGTSVSSWLHAGSLQSPVHAGSSLADFSALKMEAIRSSETSVHTRSTQGHIPEDGIPHSHRCENLKSYTMLIFTTGLHYCRHQSVRFISVCHRVNLSSILTFSYET